MTKHRQQRTKFRDKGKIQYGVRFVFLYYKVAAWYESLSLPIIHPSRYLSITQYHLYLKYY